MTALAVSKWPARHLIDVRAIKGRAPKSGALLVKRSGEVGMPERAKAEVEP
jgi:hypothetical protein